MSTANGKANRAPGFASLGDAQLTSSATNTPQMTQYRRRRERLPAGRLRVSLDHEDGDHRQRRNEDERLKWMPDATHASCSHIKTEELPPSARVVRCSTTRPSFDTTELDPFTWGASFGAAASGQAPGVPDIGARWCGLGRCHVPPEPLQASCRQAPPLYARSSIGRAPGRPVVDGALGKRSATKSRDAANRLPERPCG